LREGLVDPMQRERAIQETIELLERLRADPRWEEIDRASVRYHEVPYSQPRSDGGTDFGQIDLLYQVGDKWYLVDFKTEALGDEEALDAVMEKKYHDQMKRYTWAVEGAMGVIPTVHLCFLDYQGRIKWKEVESA
jgi:ATP-dependent exoDNAse (exonuclease V) beta subunit